MVVLRYQGCLTAAAQLDPLRLYAPTWKNGVKVQGLGIKTV
jgi:hypothetical protein